MTTFDQRTPAGATEYDCGCTSGAHDLPLHPWTDLRATTGMLLGADDFEVLMGNPRGKHWIHNAWLHGRGVVWGLPVARRGEWDLEVAPGLAVDGCGRELHLDAPQCLSMRPLLEQGHDPTSGSYPVDICLILRFDTCLNESVQTLADPCDVTRESTDWSRVVERAKPVLVRDRRPDPPAPYHRVRVLLGLDEVGQDDPAGEHARSCRDDVAATPAPRRAARLLQQFRRLAAEDAAHWHPARLEGDCASTLFPVEDDDAGVVLARFQLKVRDESGLPVIEDYQPDTCPRPTLIPTSVLQDLTCALAPGLIGIGEDGPTDSGPKVIADSVTWNDDATELRFRVTADLVSGSVRRAIKLTSLGEREWVEEDLMGPPRYDETTRTVVVELADRPVNPTVRLLVRGTGPTPVYGSDPVAPLAGLTGEPPGNKNSGRDAVLTLDNPLLEGRNGS